MQQQNEYSSDEMGLLALGVSNRWQIDVDECINSQEYLMELDGPHFYFVFQLSGLESVSRMTRYLAEGLRQKKSGQLAVGDNERLIIGQYDSTPVSLVWDDEESARCFLVTNCHKSTMRFTFDEKDVGDLLTALDQVLADLS